MIITIIDRAAQNRSWGHSRALISAYVHTVEISDLCPKCCGPRGIPALRNFYEDGESYAVHCWNNPCGHVDRYEDVLDESVARKSHPQLS